MNGDFIRLIEALEKVSDEFATSDDRQTKALLDAIRSYTVYGRQLLGDHTAAE